MLRKIVVLTIFSCLWILSGCDARMFQSDPLNEVSITLKNHGDDQAYEKGVQCVMTMIRPVPGMQPFSFNSDKLRTFIAPVELERGYDENFVGNLNFTAKSNQTFIKVNNFVRTYYFDDDLLPQRQLGSQFSGSQKDHYVPIVKTFLKKFTICMQGS